MSENLGALLPPVIIAIFFGIVIWALVTADRRQRAAQAKIDAELKNAQPPNRPDAGR